MSFEIKDCCLRGFRWDGAPSGTEGRLAENDAYIAGSSKDVAVLFIHDLLGWRYSNNRLLADHYAQEAKATVFLPDFFGGEVKSADLILAGRFDELDLPAWSQRNSKEIRGPEITACAQALRSQFKRVVAIGFCYGGWACFSLGAKGNKLVDAISVGHPTNLTKEEIDAVDVPVQVISPEHDPVYTPELKLYTFTKLTELGLPFSYEYFPGIAHGFASRGDGKGKADGAGLERAKNAAVAWMKQWLYQK